MEDKKIDRLPLPLAESRVLYEKWDRGPETEIYKKIEKR
jgi:hypothetical protein